MKILYNAIILIFIFISASINIYCMEQSKKEEPFSIEMLQYNPKISEELKELMNGFDKIEWDEYLEPSVNPKKKLLKKQLNLINKILETMLKETNFKNFYDVTPEEYVHIGKMVSERRDETWLSDGIEDIEEYTKLSEQIKQKRINEINKVKQEIIEQYKNINKDIATATENLKNSISENNQTDIAEQQKILAELNEKSSNLNELRENNNWGLKEDYKNSLKIKIKERNTLSQNHLKSKIQKKKKDELKESSQKQSFWGALKRRIRR